jgi:hypothetical protein
MDYEQYFAKLRINEMYRTIYLFLTVKCFKNYVMTGRILFIIVVLVVSSILISACSSSKKMKKKCQDCPEFSQELKSNNQLAQFHECI